MLEFGGVKNWIGGSACERGLGDGSVNNANFKGRNYQFYGLRDVK